MSNLRHLARSLSEVIRETRKSTNPLGRAKHHIGKPPFRNYCDAAKRFPRFIRPNGVPQVPYSASCTRMQNASTRLQNKNPRAPYSHGSFYYPPGDLLYHMGLEEPMVPRAQSSLEVLPRNSTQVGPEVKRRTKAEYLSMLDYGDDTAWPATSNEETARLNSKNPQEEDVAIQHLPDPAQSKPVSLSRPEISARAELLHALLTEKSTSRQSAFDLYCRLPHPGVAHLSSSTRLLLLRKLSQIYTTEKDEKATMQYISVFDDLHAAGIRPAIWQWGAAMHLSGRGFKTVTMAELENATRIWKRMEDESGHTSNTHVMNILLDVAIRAGQLEMAELTLKEMRRRGLKLDRVSRLGIITLRGLKGDGHGVRAAYKDFVMADEVVDTMTLTCVITAFIRAGELSSAMYVYERMLGISEPRKEALPIRQANDNSPRKVWELGRIILKLQRQGKLGEQLKDEVRAGIALRPNVITYINLVAHHARSTGDLVTIARLLDDMSAVGVPMHGAIFIELFQGFSHHHKKMFSSWTGERLEQVWVAFKTLADTGVPNVFMGPAIAIPVLEAFRDCMGKPRAREVLDELGRYWRKTDESHVFNEDYLMHVADLFPPWHARRRNIPYIDCV